MPNLRTQPLVSIIIATYNSGHFLKQAVESVCASTYENIEIIVVDDGSTDNSVETIEALKCKHRIKCVSQRNQGQTIAKNRGIELSEGSFIAFCDADDLWEKDKLENQMTLFDNPNVGIVYSGLSLIDVDGNHIPSNVSIPFYQGQITNNLLIRNIVPFGTAVIRKECVNKNGAFNPKYKMGIDWDLWLRYSLDWEFRCTKKSTYIYRVWPGQMSNNYRGRYLYAQKILKDFYSSNRDILDNRIFNLAMADIHFNRARAINAYESSLKEPVIETIKGLYLHPYNVKGWKTLVKIFLKAFIRE